MFSFTRRMFILLLLFFAFPALYAQSQGTGEIDPVSLIGLNLEELIARFGVPRSVYPARGLEQWQDDVVFVYDSGDFYIHKDRVWQVGLKSARGIKTGDPGELVSLRLGANPRAHGNSLFVTLNEGAWPLMLRYDLDKDGNVTAIFLYRTDF
jgi:hypothetical protein